MREKTASDCFRLLTKRFSPERGKKICAIPERATDVLHEDKAYVNPPAPDIGLFWGKESGGLSPGCARF